MKKIFIPVFALMLLGSCDVLDKEPLPTVSPNTFFKTADDAEAAITAAYDALQGTGLWSQDLIVAGEMPSDNCTSANGDVNAMENLTWTPSTSQVTNIWRDSYIGINRANAVIKYIPTISMSAQRRDEILGEAHFLRGLNYFNLVKLYGGVPLRLEPTETGAPEVVALPRASVEAVYAQVIADLTFAAEKAPAAKNFRASQAAANAILARVQLTQRQWGPAMAAATKVLNNRSYSLNSSFKSLFPANNTGESIFEIQNSGTTDGNNILPDLLLPNPPATYSFPKFNIPTAELVNLGLADKNDKRWAAIGPVPGGVDHASYVDGGPGSGNDNGPFVYKWPGNPNAFNSPDNTYVIRLAEVYLIYAEAANEQGNPATDVLAKLNEVRRRAGLADFPATGATKESLRAEIDKQRRLELAFEGERWYDLLRYARHELADPSAKHAKTALDIIAEKRQGNRDVNYLLFPIPQNERNNNAQLSQNPGY
ncbi:RagB/SusD family nutrient uptake outer membrane protein [Hymenobacter metallicola]|uniref:RagB/SusD family nutrient uptake outer membrane protein n=1 Tax=Hymenobacter metallicola TaxID=2563114 RepID=A0A4Z0Q0M2_9BACT|nr:RagB/SusD family nutrient uptake outer membrane protein [Hymenobacter metallicola]TGE23580.1 RagB/SusD family nutrient uptake outer membrane protein [Hymenobacter metallicola]